MEFKSQTTPYQCDPSSNWHDPDCKGECERAPDLFELSDAHRDQLKEQQRFE